jgi:D-3-phosphoglycerate dehydrogenase
MSQTDKPVVLVTGADLAPQALALLDDYEVVFAGARPEEQDLVSLVESHDPVAIVVRYGRITPRVIGAAKSLRVISKHGTGVDTIDLPAARARGIEVRAAAGANAAAVAEHAIALLLACAKSVVAMNARMHEGHWDKSTHKSIELCGGTLGLVGLGAIGQRTAQAAHALGMHVIGFDPYVQDLPDFIARASLEEIWARADAISLHCPLTPENHNLIDASVLARCRDGVIVVNTARGGLIDEDALLAAVRRGKVSSAGLDSFQQEPPPPDHPFYGEPRLILSPHVGGVTRAAYVNMGCAAARNLLSVLAAPGVH